MSTISNTPKTVHFSQRLTESLMNINKVIQENKSTLDSIQDMAIELTRSMRTLERASVKYIKMVDNVLEQAIPILRKIPLVNKKILSVATDVEAMTSKFLATCELAEKVLPGVETGLTSADMGKLQSSTGDVQKLTQSLQALLSK